MATKKKTTATRKRKAPSKRKPSSSKVPDEQLVVGALEVRLLEVLAALGGACDKIGGWRVPLPGDGWIRAEQQPDGSLLLNLHTADERSKATAADAGELVRKLLGVVSAAMVDAAEARAAAEAKLRKDAAAHRLELRNLRGARQAVADEVLQAVAGAQVELARLLLRFTGGAVDFDPVPQLARASAQLAAAVADATDPTDDDEGCCCGCGATDGDCYR